MLAQRLLELFVIAPDLGDVCLSGPFGRQPHICTFQLNPGLDQLANLLSADADQANPFSFSLR